MILSIVALALSLCALVAVVNLDVYAQAAGVEAQAYFSLTSTISGHAQPCASDGVFQSAANLGVTAP
jgi:hypothetical protein